jgi:FkbM family methyltransferase
VITRLVDFLVWIRTSLSLHKIIAADFDAITLEEGSKAQRFLTLRKSLSLVLIYRGQLAQDIAALKACGFKADGYFVEIGAANGRRHSNTYLLEKKYGWAGIVAEPAQIWHESLQQNRTCKIDFRFVSNVDGESIEFVEAQIPTFSTAKNHISSDHHQEKRQHGAINYFVSSVSLNTLFKELNAPVEIDYLSLDTEGSEFDILSTFDWGKYQIKFITIEHNFSQNRSAINSLLVKNGYRRILADVSRWDDWFIRE